MKQLAALGLAIAALVWILFFGLGRDRPNTPDLDVRLGDNAVEEAEPDRAQPTLTEEPVAEERSEQTADVSTRERVGEPTAEKPAKVDTTLAGLRGRFLYPNGTPAAGVKLKLRAWRGSTATAPVTSSLPEWTDVNGESDEQGAFTLLFPALLTHLYALGAEPAGYAEESWLWHDVAAGKTVDIGDITLRPTGSVQGTIVTADGTPMKHSWVVRAIAVVPPGSGAERSQTSVSKSNDPETGTFLFEGLPAGQVRLTATSQIAQFLKGGSVQVVAGQTTETTLVYTGPDITRRLAINVSAGEYYSLDGTILEAHITGQGINRTIAAVPQSSGLFEALDLEPGLYTIEIDDERFLPWRKDGVQPGEKVRAKLTPNAQLQLTLVDEGSGEPVESCSLSLQLDDYTDFHPNTFNIHESGPLPDGGLIAVLPGSSVLNVYADGYGPISIPIPSLAPYEVRPLRLELRREATLRGRVVSANGKPMPGTQVVLMAPGAKPAPTKTWVGGGDDYVGALQETNTDEGGRFVFSGLEAGVYDVHAVASPSLVTGNLGLILEAGMELNTTLKLQAPAALLVRIVDYSDKVPADFNVILRMADDLAYSLPSFQRDAFLDDNELYLKRTGKNVWAGRDLPGGSAQALFGGSSVKSNGRSTLAVAPRLLGDVNLVPGETTQIEFSVADIMPAKLTVTVLANGNPYPGVQVRVAGEDWRDASMGTTNDQGVAEIDGVFPGSYGFNLRLPNNAIYTPPKTVVVQPGGQIAATIQYTSNQNTLQVNGKDGQPLNGLQVKLRSDALIIYVPTDENGIVTASLPPGEYEVSIRDLDFETLETTFYQGSVQWPNATGEELAIEMALVKPLPK